MQKITFINARGESVVIGYQRPFFLNKIEGLGDVDAVIQSQKSPYQDGSTPIDVLLSERSIHIEVEIFDDLKRNASLLTRIFNPKLGAGKLVYENEFVKREIMAIPDHVPTMPDDRPRMTKSVVIDLLCPNPYWQSPFITEEPAFEPLFVFPFEGEFEMGMQRDRRIITNDGDAPAPIQVEFFGPALNPKIINNTTGEYIKVNQQLQEGERMLIDTTDGQKSVFFVSENGGKRNVFNWIDLSSSFFKLQIGENDIEYTADSDIQGTIVNISYSKLYTAV